MNENKKKYKPVVFGENAYAYYRNNMSQQNLLLKAMTITQDPKELRKMIGVKAVADVYRTLDKLAIRKEYHKALGDKGFTLDKIVGGIQGIAEKSEKDTTRLKAYQIILKSLGLDQYQETEDEGKNWEEVLLAAQEKERDVIEAGGEAIEVVDEIYSVVQPELPESVKKIKKEESDIGKELYAD